MQTLEQLLGLIIAAVMLAGAARRLGAPYLVFLAVGGALNALLPSGPAFTLPPELAFALFVAPRDRSMVIQGAAPRNMTLCAIPVSHHFKLLKRKKTWN